METSNKPIANPVVVLREEFDDWAVLFNPDTADAVGINPIAVDLWKLMDGKLSLEEIMEEIKGRFADVPYDAIDDITGFVNKLAETGFVGYELKED